MSNLIYSAGSLLKISMLIALLFMIKPFTVAADNHFDFDNGNAAVEVIIPTAVPAAFAVVKPGDASLVLRITTMLTNGWFDATAPYHPTAVGVYSQLGRVPESERTNRNINTAIFYASYRTLNSLFPASAGDWRAMMLNNGLDPDNNSSDLSQPEGIGNVAAEAMLAVREHDGMNQFGNEGGQIYNLQPYADYTGYAPRNSAYALTSPGHWQPDIRVSPFGISTVQQFITPQYGQVLPYSLSNAGQYQVAPPDKSKWRGNAKAKGVRKPNGPNRDYISQAEQVIQAVANLSDEQKMMAELFDDKIRSLGFSGIFAALSNQLSIIEFVQYDFLVNVAAFDAGIVMWRLKAEHDAVRPFSAIRFLYAGDTLVGWGGPGVGTVSDMPGEHWQSYLPAADHPEYPSGSTGFCEAHAQASRLYFNSDLLGWTVPTPAGSSVIEPGVTPASDINLHWDTWSAFAEDCGNSRFWAGVHFRDAIDNMRTLGSQIGSEAYYFVQAHIAGNAP